MQVRARTVVQGMELREVLGRADAVEAPWKMGWEDPRLAFVVREPFISRHSTAHLISGFVTPGQPLVIESRMPSGGVIFSDGVEEDFLAFSAGATAHIRPADPCARLVVP